MRPSVIVESRVPLAACLFVCTSCCACGLVDPGPPREPKRHRASAAACTAPRPAGKPSPSGCYGGVDRCETDADCTEGANPRCTSMPSVTCRSGPVVLCSADDCTVDGDCPSRGVCMCRDDPELGTWYRPPLNLCVRAGNCRVDADCPGGQYCSVSRDVRCGPSGDLAGYFCHTAKDECTDNEDCGPVPSSPTRYCAYDPATGRWVCGAGVCTDG